MKPIDAVILWVDGNDPAIIRKHAQYSDNPSVFQRDDIAGISRFSDTREIEYCVSSILTFAPFFRNIFIITDNQDPGLDSLILNHFPDRKKSIKIIDHTEIFRGFEKFLPSFNTNSLETMMWRIPELSERFVYFNDDVFLAAPVCKEDFFTLDDRPIGYWKSANRWIISLLDTFKKGLGFKHYILNSAKLVDSKIIPLLGHTPMSLTRSGMEKIFIQHPEWLELNLQDRFRSARQFNPQALYYLIEPNERRDFMDRRLFFKPSGKKRKYMERKIRKSEKMDKLIFGCINSFDRCDERDRELFNHWFNNRLKNV